MRQSRAVLLATLAAGTGFILLVLALAIAMNRGVGSLTEGRTAAPVALREAPQFTLPTFDGGRFDLASVSDRPVFVYFWASWCQPCEQEAPVIEALWPEYRARGYVFLGLNIWDQPADARKFVERFRLTFPMATDDARTVYVDYGVQGLPTAFFIAPGGEVKARYDGQLREQALRDLLDELAPGGTRTR